ncbi:DNA ligase 1 isoform X2 [Phoenix dactylifera]|uniref:DNA ligase 1 isoform X2 n=1 Tax=Phoenix dactylifera TaxID=42345 RepID=A0A8B8J9A3_PHODC|nr:DNA ligase 1 isoform X2 [Phoenix dactylifera]
MGGGRRKAGKIRPHGGRATGGGETRPLFAGGTRPLFAGGRSAGGRRFTGSSPPPSSISAIDGSFRGGRGKKNGSRRAQGRGNAFAYAYPTAHGEISGGDDAGCSILLARFGDNPPIVAFVDSGPCEEPGVGVPTYAYDPAVVGGMGLGFGGEGEEEEEEIVVYDPAAVRRVGLDFRRGEEEEEVGRVGLGFRGGEEEKEEEEEREEEEEKEEEEERKEEEEQEEGNDEWEEMGGFDTYSTPDVKKEGKGKGFLSIGGVRVYTEDTSSPSEGSDGFEDDVTDDGDGDSCEEDGMLDSADESLPDSEEEEHYDGDSLSFDDDSDIDDEVAEDYMEGIGGSSELLSAGWLVAENLESSDEDGLLKSGDSSDGDNRKLGGISLMNASKEYGMKKPSSRKGKGSSRNWMTGSPVVDGGLSALDDMLFVKDPRMAWRKKKSSSHLSQSWPREARKSKKYNNVPGGKKKHRKELIAMKRRQRMINRGVDLDQINSKLRKMVIDELDMLSFQPMHSRDCSQVQRLASVYQLRSGSQGSGKKRFVTVTRTGKTCLPSSTEKLRLDKGCSIFLIEWDALPCSDICGRGCLKTCQSGCWDGPAPIHGIVPHPGILCWEQVWRTMTLLSVMETRQNLRNKRKVEPRQAEG